MSNVGRIQPLEYSTSVALFENGSNQLGVPRYVHDLIHASVCPYCGEAVELEDRSYTELWGDETCHERYRCNGCGWWRSHEIPNKYFRGSARMGVLHIADLRERHLLANAIDQILESADRLRAYDPTKFEKLVGDVMKEFLGCQVDHVGKSNDGGIDLILMHSDRGPIPVQVKRRQADGKVESVALVREFRGAMVLAGFDEGLIVSTADHYSRQAMAASVARPEHLLPQKIDLVDCRRFLDILRVLKVSST
ncbi:restriction endonuclease [Prosthecochloris aestuarii DSM 271]|uniref:Restriction endonuclease n=2 Tax=Prosthecochloris aestuarii TaxID=1102 RepID=B4S507_PROA2|nr:restriction endonuclease [Prosthecochloris aestuarii DSM 271]